MMFEETKCIAKQPWMHIEEATDEYQRWLNVVQTSNDVQQLVYLWKHAYLQDWYLDLIQYPLLKRLYEIAMPNPLLYLHLQVVAMHTPWATLEEVDGKYLIESFFFFPNHLLTLYERVIFLLYEGYPSHIVQQAGQDLLEWYSDEIPVRQLLEFLASQPATVPVVAAPKEMLDQLMQQRNELYQQECLHFVSELKPKSKKDKIEEIFKKGEIPINCQ